MPIINVTIGNIDGERKQRLISELTSTASGVTDIPEQGFTVVIHEMDDLNIGWAGKTLAEHKKEH